MRLPDIVRRLLGRDVVKPEAIERADHVLENVESIQVRLVPKNARALAELRRLSDARK